MPWEFDPYGIPLNALYQRAFVFEGGKLRYLRPRHRAIVTAFALVQTDLIPRGGKETLFFTCCEYTQRHDEREFAEKHLKKAEGFLQGIGLLQPATPERLAEKAEALASIFIEEAAEQHKKPPSP